MRLKIPEWTSCVLKLLLFTFFDILQRFLSMPYPIEHTLLICFVKFKCLSKMNPRLLTESSTKNCCPITSNCLTLNKMFNFSYLHQMNGYVILLLFCYLFYFCFLLLILIFLLLIFFILGVGALGGIPWAIPLK